MLSGVQLLLRIVEESSEENANVRVVNHFALRLLEELQMVVNGAIRSGKLRKGAMYHTHHEFVTSSLTVEWEKLELQMHKTFDQSLLQLIADSYLWSTIKEISDTLPSPCSTTAMRQLSEVEENAIMHAAGYVVRVLIQKYKKGSDFIAANFVSCLTHMLEGCSNHWVSHCIVAVIDTPGAVSFPPS